MEDFVVQFGSYVSTYGYAALFGLFLFGLMGLLPVPEETLLVFAGFLVSTGELTYLSTLLVCYFGSIAGMTAAYWIGYKLGHPFIEKRLKRFEKGYRVYKKTEEWFQRFGKWAIPIGYFIPGVRQYTAYFAGITELPFRIYAILAYLGGLFWTTLFVTLGMVLGDNWAKLFEMAIKKITVVIIIVFVVGVSIAYLVHRFRKRKAGENINHG
ncbi:DedA family protein [Brevibacillus daliensis]|uniref:DedA family protein n=1 Tax=Brevibacillus daliensis TaxID=2892995 RepID=UPI001E65C901|nr:DedA family protein [Brevibacillus daliensis]